MDDAWKERRYKLIHVPHDMVRLIITGITHEFMEVPVRQPLPDDFHVVDVHYDLEYRGFSVCMWSSEWDIVPDGERVPYLDSPAGLDVVVMRKGKDGKWGVAEENPLHDGLTCGECQVFRDSLALIDQKRACNNQPFRHVCEHETACVKLVTQEATE